MIVINTYSAFYREVQLVVSKDYRLFGLRVHSANGGYYIRQIMGLKRFYNLFNALSPDLCDLRDQVESDIEKFFLMKAMKEMIDTGEDT